MGAVWTLAKKEFRLLLRDRLATLILLVMPLLFILILGLLLGEGFGQKNDDKLKIALVDLDQGQGLNPGETWARVVQRDLAETAGIQIEIVPDLDKARDLVAFHRRAAVVVFNNDFSDQVNRCSFLSDGINPFFRDGVELGKLHVDVLRDANQPAASAIIEQVVQVTMLRVLMPWMISRAFTRLSDPEFIKILGNEVNLPVPVKFQLLLGPRITLGEMLEKAADKDPKASAEYRSKVGQGVQAALKQQFSKYDLTGKTWASLTRANDHSDSGGAEVVEFQDRDGNGLLRRGAQRYQILVPSYTVMFAFFLVMNVGWIFVSERRQGTLKRLRTTPLTRGQVLLGKLIPCFCLSLAQGLFLLIAGRILFGMRWGPEQWSLPTQLAFILPVVICTSLAAMGMALLVAAIARTEMQVALYGAVPVLVLALIGGCVLPREMMPEQAQRFTFLAPQGWALEAYRELLNSDAHYLPNLTIVAQSCGVLALFGLVFLGLAWLLLRLD